MVGLNATVALIDADSFQYEQNGRRFPCLVGVADFTPPELQGLAVFVSLAALAVAAIIAAPAALSPCHGQALALIPFL